jgi:OmpA-OmpF porin, OOP family
LGANLNKKEHIHKTNFAYTLAYMKNNYFRIINQLDFSTIMISIFKPFSILLILTILSMFCQKIKAQNQISNPSFEDYINFDTAQYIGWHKVQNSDTPDYFNLNPQKPSNNVFDQFMGGANPKTGNGFIGIFCYRQNPSRLTKNVREYVETKLLNSLNKDSLYKFEISLCLDAESNIAVKNFGVYFSQSPLQFNKDSKTFALKPQIEFNSSFLDSTNSWITLESFYKADGTEKYITIGNFKADKSTKTKSLKPKKNRKKKKWDLSSLESAAYYYIDDVSLEAVITKVEKPDAPISETQSELKDTFNLSEISVDSAIILKNIIFEFDKYDLLPQSYTEIEKLYRLLISNPKIRIKLEGHTDNVGSYEFNLQLSLKRVQTVTKYLIEKGISPDRIEFSGYSYSVPLVSNKTEEGRTINRRVAFKIIDK